MNKQSIISDSLSTEDLRIYRSMNLIYLISGIVHLFFLISFYFLGVFELVYFNLLSIIAYLISLYLNRKGKFLLAGIIGMSEVTIHAILAVFYLGWNSGFHYYIILTFMAIFFLIKKNVITKILFALPVLFIYIGLHQYHFILEPNYQFSEKILLFFTYFNLITMVIVLFLFSFFYTQTINLIEENLKNSEREQRNLNAAKDKYFSILSHDIKNPLNSSIGFSDLLINRFDEISDEKKKRYILLLSQSLKKLLELIENVLQWSMAQSGRIEYQPENIRLDKIVGNSIKLLQNSIQRKGINIFNKSAQPEYAWADRNMINTVILNILTNSIKFTHENGEIQISYRKWGKFIYVDISDNGIGMSTEELNSLFKIDEKFSKKGTNEENGSGFGLVLCKEFIELNNGEIQVKSELHKGATFTVVLPIEANPD